jgi:hypothetical protein
VEQLAIGVPSVQAVGMSFVTVIPDTSEIFPQICWGIAPVT